MTLSDLAKYSVTEASRRLSATAELLVLNYLLNQLIAPRTQRELIAARCFA